MRLYLTQSSGWGFPVYYKNAELIEGRNGIKQLSYFTLATHAKVIQEQLLGKYTTLSGLEALALAKSANILRVDIHPALLAEIDLAVKAKRHLDPATDTAWRKIIHDILAPDVKVDFWPYARMHDQHGPQVLILDVESRDLSPEWTQFPFTPGLEIICADGGSLCWCCAIKEIDHTTDPDEMDQWMVIGQQEAGKGGYICDHCGNEFCNENEVQPPQEEESK